MWTLLYIIAAIGLVCFWHGPNAVWGGVTLGLIGGLIAAGIYHFTGSGFRWSTVGTWIVVSVLVGIVVEVIWRISRRNSN